MSTKFDQSQIGKAVDALYAYHKAIQQKQKKKSVQLFDETPKIYLQVSLWQIEGGKNKRYSLPVPHSIWDTNSASCLIVKDMAGRDKESTSRFYKDMLAEKGVQGITEVMTLKTLKTEYRPFEAQRQLAKLYDLFLADDRIMDYLPTYMGKEFKKKRKYPLAVSLTKKDLKKELQKTINCTHATISGRGACSGFAVAHMDLSQKESSENISAAINRLAAKIPLHWKNFRSIHIKTHTSVALPIYISTQFGNGENTQSVTDIPAPPPVDENPMEQIKRKKKTKKGDKAEMKKLEEYTSALGKHIMKNSKQTPVKRKKLVKKTK